MVISAENILHKQDCKGYCDGAVYGNSYYEQEEIKLAMVEFARMHCEAQAKAIVEKTKLIPNENQDLRFQSCNCIDYILDTESILNAYPLENIK